ncbi:ABC transporter permease subunit [Glaciibacter sp. 2TAF33]|uniref:ABC transporter permease subunit n=1 Tax=Glaciibacter sp. 2TAF33 TaxID=3233015 RepID=UPI003F8EEF59
MTTTSPAPAHQRASFIPTGSGLSFAGILRSEWIKLRSLRSTMWSYLLVMLISVGMAALMSSSLSSGTAASLPEAQQAGFLLQASTFGIYFGQLVVAVLGVLVFSGEYSTGMIKSTLTAAPRRLSTLWAKSAVLFTATYVVGLVGILASFMVASPILAAKGIHGSLFDGDVIVPILGGALYLALIAVFALGVGAILRSSAGGIAASLGTLLVLPVIFQLIPADWAADVVPYLVSNAGFAMFGAGMGSPLEPWQGFTVLAGWIVVAIGAAAVLLKRRDA